MSGTAIDLWERLQCAGGSGTSRTEYRAGDTDRAKSRADGAEGSVTVQLTPGKEGTSVADVEFSLTKVGEIQDSTYTLLPEYESTKIDLNTLTTAEQLEGAAKTLAETSQTGAG